MVSCEVKVVVTPVVKVGTGMELLFVRPIGEPSVDEGVSELLV